MTTQQVHPGMDKNFNVTANNVLEGYATTVTAAALTTLSVVDAFQQFFTGTMTQTVKMPVVTTLVLGQSWYIVNNSSGVVTVESSGANTIKAMAANSWLQITCIKVTADTTAAAWSYEYGLQTPGAGSVTSVATGNGLTGGTITGSGTISVLPTVIAKVTTATLDSTAFSALVTVGGASAYAVILPAHSAGNYIQFQSITTSYAIVTLTPASGTINGQATIALGSGDSLVLYDDGTNYWIQSLTLAVANAYIYLNNTMSTVSHDGSTVVKVTYDTVLYDIGGFADVVTNHRYTPLLPGKYSILQNLKVTPSTSFVANDLIESLIYQNAAELAQNNDCPGANANVPGQAVPVQSMIAMNGSTDYIEGKFLLNTTGAMNITGAQITTNMIFNRISLF